MPYPEVVQVQEELNSMETSMLAIGSAKLKLRALKTKSAIVEANTSFLVGYESAIKAGILFFQL